MKSLVWLGPLLLAFGLGAQDIGTSLINPAPARSLPAATEPTTQETEAEGIEASPVDPASSASEANVSPFWEDAESLRLDPFSTVARQRPSDLKAPPGPPVPVLAHTVVFRTEDTSVVLDAAAGGRTAEAALFNRVLSMEQEGTATIVLEHQSLNVGGRAASTSIVRSAVYPTEWHPDVDPLRLFPAAYETRQLGDSASITPRFLRNGIHAQSQAASVRWGRPTRWPVFDPAMPPGPERTIFNLQPQILVDECTTTALAQPGETRLLGIAQEARPADDTTSAPAWRLSFGRVTPVDEAASPAEASANESAQGVRCDVLVFRLPLDEVAEWLIQPGPRDEAAAWEALLSKARTGEVTVVAQWSLAAVTGPVRPGGPPEASLQSLGEFIYPTEYGGFAPMAFETRNTGASCSLRLRTAVDGVMLVGALDVNEVRLDPLRRWPSSATAPDVCLLQPEFVTRELRTDIVLPANGITFLGLRDAETFGAAGEDTESMADLYIVKSSADPLNPPAGAPKAPPMVEWRSLVFSVDDAAASDLQLLVHAEAATPDTDPGARLWNWVADGRAHLRHAAAVVMAEGGFGSVMNRAEVIYPTGFQDENGLITFKNFETQVTGLRLRVRPTVHADRETVTGYVEFTWASAPPQMPEFADYRREVDAGVTGNHRPEFFDPPDDAQNSSVTLPAGISRLLRLEKARAPAGSPDHGRWHAVLVSAVIRGD
jgi:hypothetical protein